jgi:hypothetical protein
MIKIEIPGTTSRLFGGADALSHDGPGRLAESPERHSLVAEIPFPLPISFFFLIIY